MSPKYRKIRENAHKEAEYVAEYFAELFRRNIILKRKQSMLQEILEA